MNKQEILTELEEKFKILKKEMGFKASLEELDEAFSIKDAVLMAHFVSQRPTRQICSRIVDTYMIWTNYLHSLIMPNPGNMITINESKMLNDEEKKKIISLISLAMEISSKNNYIGLTKDKKEESRFIDYSLNLWEKSFKPELMRIIKKINENWKSK